MACACSVSRAQAIDAVAAMAPSPDAARLELVVVYGCAERIGTAVAASEGGSELSVRPLLRTAELLEAVPGMIAAQHSGSGKANQYFLQGFNLDHDTDFSLVLDDCHRRMNTPHFGRLKFPQCDR